MYVRDVAPHLCAPVNHDMNHVVIRELPRTW